MEKLQMTFFKQISLSEFFKVCRIFKINYDVRYFESFVKLNPPKSLLTTYFLDLLNHWHNFLTPAAPSL